jgi:8-oxo-dGTP diphosphatase
MAERGAYTYDYPRPMVTVDIVLLREVEGEHEVLLVRRGKPPFEGLLALPGGFVEMDEDLPDAAARELAEETGLTGIALEQLGAFGKPGRDPRGRNIAIAFVGTAPPDAEATAGDDADAVFWLPANGIRQLAFDHADILALAQARSILYAIE